MSSLLKCPECEALFYYQDDLDAHFNAWHKPGGPFYLVCPKCGKKMESKASLEEHLSRHPEEEKTHTQLVWGEEELEEEEEE
ncbi:MAG: hypothetical protein NZ954_00780 [Thermofilaceae archaeon]|nr:hypothetical protein [Thermofilaceae archaeon]MCX8180284.1 hypothetical protein [Thermofilaceae archaeon]MDW8003996.1 C2H2-type zinc finger protein [Thermofilaceae archaeon]